MQFLLKMFICAALLVLVCCSMSSAAQWAVVGHGNCDPMCVGTEEGSWAYRPAGDSEGYGNNVGDEAYWEIVDNGSGGKAIRIYDNSDGNGSNGHCFWWPNCQDRGIPACSAQGIKNQVPGFNGFTFAIRFKIDSFTPWSGGPDRQFLAMCCAGDKVGGGMFGGKLDVWSGAKNGEANTLVMSLGGGVGWMWKNTIYAEREPIDFCDGQWHTLWFKGEMDTTPDPDAFKFLVWLDGQPVMYPDDNEQVMKPYYAYKDFTGPATGKLGFQSKEDKVDYRIDWWALSYNAAGPGEIADPVEPAPVYAGNSLAAAKTFAAGAVCGTSTAPYFEDKCVTASISPNYLGLTSIYPNPPGYGFYVSEQDGSAGMMIFPSGKNIRDWNGSPATLQVGDRVRIKGNVVDLFCDKACAAWEVIKLDPATHPRITKAEEPVLITNKTMVDSFQTGCLDALDKPTRITGLVTYADTLANGQSMFYVDDGTNYLDMAAFVPKIPPDMLDPFAPVKGVCCLITDTNFPYANEYVIVTGVSGVCWADRRYGNTQINKAIPCIRVTEWKYWDE